MTGHRYHKYSKQWYITIGILLLFGMAIAYHLHLDRRRIESREYNRLLVQTRVIDENLNHQLTATYQAMQQIVRDLPFWRTNGSYRPVAILMLKAMEEAMPGVRTLVLIDAKGVVRASNRPELIGRNLGQREYFQTVLKHPDPATLYLSLPYTTVLNVYAMNLSCMVPGPGGKFNGLVVATLEPEYFKTLLASVQYAPDMWVAIAHGDGIQYLMVPDRPGQSGKNLAQPGSFFTRHRESGKTETISTGTVYATGEERVMAVRTVQPREAHLDKPLVVAVGRDLQAVYARWQEDVIDYGIFFLVTVLITVFSLRHNQLSVQQADAEARKSKEALEQSETRYRLLADYNRSLIEASLDPLVTIGPNGTITDVNEATIKVTGIPRDTLIGTDFSNYFTEPGKAQEGYQQVFAMGSVTDYPLTIRHNDGRLTDVLYNAAVYRDVQGRVLGVFAAARDVTESRRIMREFAETKNFLDNILQSSTKYSIIGKDLDHKILSWNEGARRNYGYSADEIVGKDSGILHTREDIESGAVDKMMEMAREKGLAEGEFVRVRKDGSRFMASVVVTRRNDAAGRPIGFLLMSTDISEKKQTENALRESEQRFRRLVEFTPIPIGLVSNEGKVLYFNDRFIKTFGYTTEDVPTIAEWWQRAYPDDEYRRWVVDTWSGAVAKSAREQVDIEPHEYNVTCKDGTVRIVEISGITIEENLLATFIDITDRRQAEESVRQALREKETLLREIHHRVKNNLQVVSSLLDLQSQKIEDGSLREMFQESQQRVKSMAMVHEKMYQTKSLSDIDFRDYVSTIVGELSSYFNSAARGITTATDVMPIALNLDLAIPCALIINELLTNAYKHAFPDSRSGSVSISFNETDGVCTLSIADNGVGLPPDFDSIKNMSLGYQLVTVLVKQLRGSMRIESVGGTAVSITFKRKGAADGKG